MPPRNQSKAGQGTPVTVTFSDSINLIRDQVQWSPKGVRLLTRWSFPVGTEVEFAFDHRGEKHCCVGVVVACHPLRDPARHFETVLYFIEAPCRELQKAACDCQLAADGAESPAEDGLDGASLRGGRSGKPGAMVPRSRM
jgi:hypothetical protein